ncbi:hypothetical protein ACN47E_008574 [Coniothyrium glycines]
MLALFSFRHLLFVLFALLTNIVQASDLTPFGCLGGSLYFVAHPVDVLLFANPDLYHDLYVFKCVTTVVFTVGDRGLGGNASSLLERGLGEAFSLMTGSPVHRDWPVTAATKLQIGDHEVDVWSPLWTENVHNVYIRLPDGGLAGQGLEAYGYQSVKKLHDGAINSIVTTDGNATYTLDSLKSLIATIIDVRRPTDIKTLSHMAPYPSDEQDMDAEHVDHIITAQLVIDVMREQNVTACVQSYAGNVMRSFEANLNITQRDFHIKAQAYFRYAEEDSHMCQSIQACNATSADDSSETVIEHDVKYVARYLEREYYAI